MAKSSTTSGHLDIFKNSIEETDDSQTYVAQTFSQQKNQSTYISYSIFKNTIEEDDYT